MGWKSWERRWVGGVPKLWLSQSCCSSKVIRCSDTCHNSVARSACLCVVLLHWAICLVVWVMLSRSLYASMRAVFKSGNSMSSWLLFGCFFRPIFCSARSSSGSSSSTRACWIVLFSACSSAMHVAAETWARVRNSISLYVVPNRSKALNSYASKTRSLYPRTLSSEIWVVCPCSILPVRDKVTS